MIFSIGTGRANTGLAIKNSMMGLLSLGCRLIGNLIIFVVIARLPGVSANEFGQITYAVALTSIFVMVSQFGLIPLLIRDTASDHSLLAKYAGSAMSLRLIFSAIGLLLLSAYIELVDITEQGRMICHIMAAAMYIGSFSADLQAIFQGRESMHLEFIGIAMENCLLLGMALLAYLLDANAVQVSFIFLVSKSTAFAFNYLVCGRIFLWVLPRIDLGLWSRMVRDALPFALTGIIATGIVQLDTVLIRELLPGSSDESVGMYQAAVRLFLVPMLLPEIIGKVFLPQLSRMHGRTGSGLKRDLGRVNHILLTLGLLIGIVTLFRGDDLINLIYGDKFAAAGPILKILGVTIMMRFGAAYNLYFTIKNRVWFRVFSASLALAAVLVFDMLLIPRFGALGAAYASVLAHIVYWIPYLGALFAAERTIALGWNPVKAAVLGMLLSGFLAVTDGFHLSYMLPIYASICLFAAFISMPAEDRSRIWTRFQPKGA